jgi:hypothetical protein
MEEYEQESTESEVSEVKIDIKELARVNELPFKLPKALRYLLDGFKWAIDKKNQSAVTIVDGRSGMGKTTLSLQMASYMSPNFSIDDVYFTPEKFLEGLANTKKGDKKVLVFDEAMLLSSRAALSQINRMIVIAMSMIRSKNIFIIFNVNSIFDIDRNLALSRADLLLHCYGDSLTDKGRFLAFFKGADGMDRIKDLYINGKKFYSYARPKANFYSTFSSYFTVDEIEYERRKQEGVNKFLSTSGSKMGNKDKLARNKAIIKLYEICDAEGKRLYTQKDIAEMLDIGITTVKETLYSNDGGGRGE